VTVQAKARFDRRCDARIPELYRHLQALHRVHAIRGIAFEDVQFSSSTMQTQLWASLRATVWLFAALHGVKIECLATGRLKQFATGHGGATKDMMAAFLVKKHPEKFKIAPGGVLDLESGHKKDDNAVDALHLYEWAVQTLKT